MNNQVACAHCKVEVKYTEWEDGTRSDYWECTSNCGCKFIPIPRAELQKNIAVQRTLVPAMFLGFCMGCIVMAICALLSGKITL